ncbi:hypothetical protein UlMin_029274 [Ulmus minor]
MFRFFVPSFNKVNTGLKGVDKVSFGHGKENHNHNQCVISPSNVIMVAKTFERRNQNWNVQTTFASDLIIQVEDSSFHLHKLSMVSRSGYLHRLIFERSNGGRDTNLNIKLDNLPGGAKTFELVVKFCYGWKVDLTPSNVAPLYCAAQFLEMGDEFEQGNLISKTKAFLSFAIFSSWKDTFQILKSCESVSSWAKELQITKRCTESISLKACANIKDFGSGEDGEKCLNSLSESEERAENWWFEDVSSLRIDHFIDAIQSMKSKEMRPDLVGSCIAHWTAKWLSKINLEPEIFNSKMMNHKLQIVTIECLIIALPTEENSVKCNFLLHLLKAGLAKKINSDLLKALERRIAYMLEQCRVPDLLVKNYGDNESVYDEDIVIRVVESYVSMVLINPTPKIFAVGRLIDGYLTLVARDENLKAKSFQLLAEALPKDARFCDDNLYRATDLFLKAHPSLTKEERTSLCRFLEHHRLSQETREHVIKNDRLPLKIVTRFILLEQVNMTRTTPSVGSNHQSTKTKSIVRANKSFGKELIHKTNNQIRKMSKEIETIKLQLDNLQICKLKIQKQIKRCKV